ncbi:hypothetical protein HZU75_16275 [Chitinibacter fontanus]|uniref:Plasmid recombination protein n=1 Tax=Chitinibacter fontanus TaxID=1737446 RepID=A0A7D5ZN28_9NEIS|nr:plasmid recombination protein [Chitinibacter fontanus]QLI82950.1 hypothetical protein HZU75_16275 [Chitinibacter fontanus]
MSGYQFIHVEAYARRGSQQQRKERKTGSPKLQQKWSAQQIADEAARVTGACAHVSNPQPPNFLYGVSPHQAAALAAQWAEKQKDTLGRKMRADGLCLLAGVVSLPAERMNDWVDFRAATINYLHHKYGERLKSVIEHVDEEHPHLHFYAVPLDNEKFDFIHDGRRASAEMAAIGKKKGEQNNAYIEAMRRFQDEFYQKVASNFGLTRDGPKRRRLTRAQWQIEQNSAGRNAKIFAIENAARNQFEKKFDASSMLPEKEWKFFGIKEPTYTADEVVSLLSNAHKIGMKSGVAHVTSVTMNKLDSGIEEKEGQLREISRLKKELDGAKNSLRRIEEVISPEELQVKFNELNLRRENERNVALETMQNRANKYLQSFLIKHNSDEKIYSGVIRMAPQQDDTPFV